MSALVGTGSIDSSGSFVEIDSENTTSSSHGIADDEVVDIKPIPNHHSPSHSFKNNFNTMGGISIPHHGLSAAFHGYHSHHSGVNNNSKSPFLLPAQLYKSLFASAVLQNPDKMNSVQPFPRNLLFSCAEKSPNSDGEVDEKCSLVDEVNFFVWIVGITCWGIDSDRRCDMVWFRAYFREADFFLDILEFVESRSSRNSGKIEKF